MKLTNEQFKALQPYEGNFTTAVKAQWSRHPGTYALDIILNVYNEVTGEKRRVNGSCQSCILLLLQDCGRIYLADKEEREATPAPVKKPRAKKAQ